MHNTEFAELLQGPQRRRASRELDDEQFLKWILGGGGLYLEEPAQPDGSLPERLDAILTELDTLRVELTDLKAQPAVTGSYRDRGKFVCVEGDDAE